MPVLMGLQGEEGFPHEGRVNFVNNQVNPTTGSILVRGVSQSRSPRALRLLSPGMFVGFAADRRTAFRGAGR